VFYLPPDALRATVDIFYERLIVDERVMFFFEGVSVSHLKRHQYKFLSVAFTEVPADMDLYQIMLDKHARLFLQYGLSDAHFDIVAGHLVATLQQLHVPENLIGEVFNILGPLPLLLTEQHLPPTQKRSNNKFQRFNLMHNYEKKQKNNYKSIIHVILPSYRPNYVSN
jgi:hemoglobin